MVILPGRRSIEYQSLLFDPPLRSPASVRNICGEFFELCTAAATGGHRLKTDSRSEVCPDIHWKDSVWFESKSVGNAGFAVVYKFRFEKDQAFAVDGRSLHYFFWHHTASVLSCLTMTAVRCQLSQGLRALFVIDLSTLAALVAGETSRLNTMYYSNKHQTGTYRGDGWKVPIKSLKASSCQIGETVPMGIRGVKLKPVPVYSTCPSIHRAFLSE